MNTPNNKKRKLSQEKIERTFVELIQTKEISEISVSDICKKANLNRTTFYSNYIDIYYLVDKINEKMFNDFFNIYTKEREEKKHSYDFLKLFKHIKENQIFYKTYFKLNLDSKEFPKFMIQEEEVLTFLGTTNNLEYHVIFFKAGLNAIIKKWLDNNCKESPEEMEEILKSEYKNKSIEL